MSEYYKRKKTDIISLTNGTGIGLAIKVTDTIAGGMWFQTVVNIPYGTTIRYAIAYSMMLPTGSSGGGATIDTLTGMGAKMATKYQENIRYSTFNVMDYGAVGDNSHDDLPAFQAAVNAAYANHYGIVYAPRPPIAYKFSGALTVTLNGKNANCQLYIPNWGGTYGRHIIIMGDGANPEDLAAIFVDTSHSGTVINSTITLGTNTGNPLVDPTVIGIPKDSSSLSWTGDWNHCYVEVKNLVIKVNHRTYNGKEASALGGINGGYARNLNIEEVLVCCNLGVANFDGREGFGTGFVFPSYSGSWWATGDRLWAYGMSNGLVVGEHAHIGKFGACYCGTGLWNRAGGLHINRIDYLNVEMTPIAIYNNTAGNIHIGSYSVEHPVTGGWTNFTYDIYGTSGTIFIDLCNQNKADFTAQAGAKYTVTNYGDQSSFQSTLVNTTNIKSINGSSILGSGNLVVTGTGSFPDTTTSPGSLLETKYDAQSKFISKSSIRSIMSISADTSMFADSTFGRIYSDGFIIDSLIFSVNSVGTSSVKLAVYYGTNWATESGATAVVTAFNTITAEGVKTVVYTFNNATVAAGNFVWVKMKGSTKIAKYWSVQIKGHYI